jgi:DnaJ homolog subfamily C member 1
VNLGVQRDEDGRPEGSKYIDVVVEGNSVYFVRPFLFKHCSNTDVVPKLDTASGAMHLINDSIAVKPAFKNTWFIKLIGKYVVYRPTQRAEAKDSTERTSEDESSDSVGDVASEKLVKHQPATKTGGKRRKAARKH